MLARFALLSCSLLACAPEPKPLATWAGDCKLYDLPNTVAEKVCSGGQTLFSLPEASRDREVIVADALCGGSWRLYQLSSPPTPGIYDCATGIPISILGQAVFVGNEFTPSVTSESFPVESK